MFYRPSLHDSSPFFGFYIHFSPRYWIYHFDFFICKWLIVRVCGGIISSPANDLSLLPPLPSSLESVVCINGAEALCSTCLPPPCPVFCYSRNILNKTNYGWFLWWKSVDNFLSMAPNSSDSPTPASLPKKRFLTYIFFGEQNNTLLTKLYYFPDTTKPECNNKPPSPIW